ncbi:hypothetical protein KKA14_11470 [bacterium]|nr:hypothetical protein [bacterium]
MSKKLSKSNVASLISRDLGLSYQTAEATLDVVIRSIQEALTVYREVTLSDFGDVPITIKITKKRTLNHLSDQKIEKQSKIPDPVQKLSEAIKQLKPGYESRKLERRNFIIDLEIYDRDSDQLIGDIGDITTEGLMIVSEEPVAEKKVFNLMVVAHEDIGEDIEMTFSAKSIRCQKTIHEHIYTTGFLIETLDKENFEKISNLINNYAV